VNSWKIILATIVIFGAGVLTGGLLVNHVERSWHQRFSHRTEAVSQKELSLPRPQILGKQFVQQLDQALNLTPEQREKIQKIIADGQERNHDLWKLVAPQFHAAMQDVHQRIREVLTPDQRKQFEDLLKQFHQSRHSPDSTNAPPAMTNAPAN
jgi:Spy/CpxP family protein refolding chaperone